MKTCLLVVDVQNGFISPATQAVPARIRTLLDLDLFDLTLFTRFRNAEGSPYRRFLGWGRLGSDEECDLCPDIAPVAIHILDKNVYTAVSPELLKLLEDHQIGAVFIAGIDTDCCVLTSATDLFEAGIRPCVLSHYSASNGGAESHTAALTCLGRLIGLHNILGGELDAEALATIVASPLPEKIAGPSLVKTSGFAATREDVDAYLALEAPAPDDLLALLDKDFRESLDSSVGVWERYTLRDHVHMVLGQFDHYFAGTRPGGLSDNEFRLLIGLHDLGKPAAVQEGDKHRQHEFTTTMASAYLRHLGWSDTELLPRLFHAIETADDPFGSMLKFDDVGQALVLLTAAASAGGFDTRTYVPFARTYFICDASSYTSDATKPDGSPGAESLDWLFDFDQVARRVSFTGGAAEKLQRLVDAAEALDLA